MKKQFKVALLTIISLTQQYNTWGQCPELTTIIPITYSHGIMDTLKPDYCEAKSFYPTTKTLVISPIEGYIEIKSKVRINQIIEIDPDNCSQTITETKRDTIQILKQLYPERPTQLTGGYWTVRMELMLTPPQTRPHNSKSTKLPKSHPMHDYWVTHYGQYTTIEEARVATKELKQQYPEFCTAFPYFLPIGCEFEFQYIGEKIFSSENY